MKRTITVFMLVLLVFAGCEKAPVETVPVSTEPVETTSVPVTLPPETTAPPETTVPPETTLPPETKEPPRVYVPQDPDPLTYPKGGYQGTLVLFAGMLYVHDNRPDTLLSALPEGFVYVGVSSEWKFDTMAKHALSTWHIADWSEFYGSPDQPDYVYYKTDGGYRQMIRAALVENYWGGEELDPELPEDYLVRFFTSLLSPSTRSQSVYAQAVGQNFETPQAVSLGELFYNGFREEREKPLTAAEEKYLTDKGTPQVSGCKRLPITAMDAVLKRFFGISYYETHRAGTEELVFWSNTNCYYSWRSDTRGYDIIVKEVRYNEENDSYEVVYAIEYKKDGYVMTLKREGDVFRIRSNVVIPSE